MTTIMTKAGFDKKIDNIQHQLDIMRRESEAFRAHANSHFEFVSNEVATKEDLYNLEDRLRGDLDDLTKIVTKIAEKVGVN